MVVNFSSFIWVDAETLLDMTMTALENNLSANYALLYHFNKDKKSTSKTILG